VAEEVPEAREEVMQEADGVNAVEERERERDSVCVCVRERERESARER
jgi:hypothetical protein